MFKKYEEKINIFLFNKTNYKGLKYQIQAL